MRISAIWARLRNRVHVALQGRIAVYAVAAAQVEGKRGIEIGGPTDLFRSKHTVGSIYRFAAPLPIYDVIGTLDNCVFSSETMWDTHDGNYNFSEERAPGRNIIADGSNILSVLDSSYDFVLSSHNIEHFANPIRALYEWKRITRAGGGLVIVIPDRTRTFDHHRPATTIEHMIADYNNCTEESDLTHAEEVIRLHDRDLDGTLREREGQELRARTLDNFRNRAMHHHTFDEYNSHQLLELVGLEILAMQKAWPYHIVVVGRW